MFRKIDDKTYASPQIGVAEVAYAKALGIGMIINNRPEDESDDQTPGPEIEAAANAAGIAYVAIPVSHAGFSMPQVTAMQQALAQAGDAPVLAYCRSGTRSTLLWALAQAQAGMNPDQIAASAADAGYDIG
ncbi:MAG: TIGR01244 family sulfur transferase, partial [Novosphingobium sp.]|nr:TIGR01244 family sulfur transferase [Novosphingobium sp.]